MCNIYLYVCHYEQFSCCIQPVGAIFFTFVISSLHNPTCIFLCFFCELAAYVEIMSIDRILKYIFFPCLFRKKLAPAPNTEVAAPKAAPKCWRAFPPLQLLLNAFTKTLGPVTNCGY